MLCYCLSDGQQFHQYQQNKQPPLTLTDNTKKVTTTYDVGNADPGLGRTEKCDVKPVNGITTLLF